MEVRFASPGQGRRGRIWDLLNPTIVIEQDTCILPEIMHSLLVGLLRDGISRSPTLH